MSSEVDAALGKLDWLVADYLAVLQQLSETPTADEWTREREATCRAEAQITKADITSLLRRGDGER